METKLFFNKKHQKIGSLKDGIFRKRVKKSLHLMKNLDAWAIQLDTLQKLNKLECEEIRVLEEEEGILYTVPMQVFWSKSEVFDWGDGQQAFLPREHWQQKQYG